MHRCTAVLYGTVAPVALSRSLNALRLERFPHDASKKREPSCAGAGQGETR